MSLSNLPRATPPLAALAALLSVAACGGGSGGKPRTITLTVSIPAEGPIEGTRDAQNNILEADASLRAGDLEGATFQGPIRAFLSFNRSVIPPEATITSAQLRLNMVEVAGNPFTAVQMGNLMVDHVNYGDTFPDATSYSGNTLLGNLTVMSNSAALGIKTATVTFGVNNDVAQNRPRSQFRLKFINGDQNFDGQETWARFVDAEDLLAEGSPPELVITYTIPNPN
jgi:hypothetical protein